MNNYDNKILYIAPQINNASGGKLVSQRNKHLLRLLVGEENFFTFEIKRKSRNPIKMLFNDIKEKNFYGLNTTDKKEIIKCIIKNNISIVFLDSSNLGGLISLIQKKCKNVKIITFFHNVEIDFSRISIQLSRRWHLYYRIWLSKYNESQAIHLSDITICLNERDANRLYEEYGKNPDFIIPVTLDSKIKEILINQPKNIHNPPNMLFFGSNFPPNIEGIKLFINKVMPHTDGFLTIAGQGMECIESSIPNIHNIKIMGYVENIDELYYNADIVVLPIFSGSGMKVKTAEALKFGKYIIASNEALEGYDVDNLKGVIRCHKIEDFISAINDYSKRLTNQNTYIKENRLRFLSLYSNDNALNKYKHILDEVNNKKESIS